MPMQNAEIQWHGKAAAVIRQPLFMPVEDAVFCLVHFMHSALLRLALLI